MVGINTFDILRGFRCPVRDHGAVAAVAARLVAKLPGENGGRVGVAVDDGAHVCFVCCLRRDICVETRGIASEGGDSAEIAPVVQEREDELDAVFLGY